MVFYYPKGGGGDQISKKGLATPQSKSRRICSYKYKIIYQGTFSLYVIGREDGEASRKKNPV